MRLRGFREPGAGFKEWSPMGSLINGHQVAYCVHQPTYGGVVLSLDSAPDLSTTKGLQGLILLTTGTGRGLDLGDRELRHQAGASSGEESSVAGTPATSDTTASSAGAGPRPAPTPGHPRRG